MGINTNLNDIRLILFEKDISTILRSQVGITSNNDIKYILDGINIYKNQYQKYKEWLNEININKEYQIILEKNSIYSKQTLFNKIRSISSLVNIFGKEQEMTAQYLWKCIQNEKKEFYKNQNQQNNVNSNYQQNDQQNLNQNDYQNQN